MTNADNPTPRRSRTGQRLWLLGMALGVAGGIIAGVQLTQRQAAIAPETSDPVSSRR